MRGKHFTKSVENYTQIIVKSWKTVWSHKSLWFVAAIAGTANTGAVFNSVINKFWNIEPAEKITVESVSQSIDAIPWATTYLKNLITLGPERIILITTLLIIIALIIALIIVGAQQILLIHSHKQVKAKKHITIEKLWNEIKHLHFFRIFSVDAGVFVLANLLYLVTTIPLSLLLTHSSGINGLVFAGFYLLILPIGFFINAIGMFSLIYIVQRNQGLIDAVTHAWKTLLKNWLSTFEIALILYVINLFASILFYLVLVVIAIPVVIFVVATATSGSIWFLAIISALLLLLATVIVLLFIGALTMFNYSVWAHLLDKYNRLTVLSIVDSIAKIFKK